MNELKTSFTKHYNALQDLPAFILASEIGNYKGSSLLEIHEILSNSSYSDAYRIDALLLMIKLVLEKEFDEKLINLDLEIVNVLIPQMRSEIQLEIREIVNSIHMKLKYKNKIMNRDKKLDFVQNQLLLREYDSS